MLYCSYHDLGFCEAHKDQCLDDGCVLEPFALATFCAVCCHVILPKPERKNETRD
jgi:hypothetical protein